MKLSGNKILITGGATGIGLGLAQRFLAENNEVIICGRRTEILVEVQKEYPSLITFTCDLTLGSDRQRLYQWIVENHPDLNVLVNNAGIQNWMNIYDADFMDKAKLELAINVEAPMHLSSLFIGLPTLTTIMNVTSGLSFVPLVKTPVYSATKAFFHSFTWSLRQMLASRNLEVVEIIPPALNTDLGGKGLHDAAPPVSDFIESIFEQLAQGKNELTFGMSEKMANSSATDVRQVFHMMNGIPVNS